MTERLLASLDEVTEHLRAMLDERGVEWWETVTFIGATITSDGIERHYLVSTFWDSPVFGKVEATDMGDGVLHMACLNGCDFTPEQAIAATLGLGSDDTALFTKTCRLISAPQYGEGCQECSACGEVLDGYLFDGGRCPNCGAKVVDE